MNETKTHDRGCWRLAACPAYDVEGTESWLAEMAANGFSLDRDGFWAGFVRFRRATPAAIRYRLDVAPAGQDAPEAEAEDLAEAAGWHYIAKRGDFHIYCTDDPTAPELHTDPQVQALALRLVRRRARGNLVYLLLWPLLYALLFSGGTFLMAALGMGSPLFLLGHLLFLWYIGGALARFLSLRSLQKRLAAGLAPQHNGTGKRRGRVYLFSRLLFVVLVLLWLVGLLLVWRQQSSLERPLSESTRTFPFATMADLLPGGQFTPDTGFGFDSVNTITARSDLLAPEMLSLYQVGSVETADGRRIEGGLQIDYYDTRAPWMARELAREWQRYDRRNNFGRHYQELILPALQADYAVAYSTYSALSPIVLLVDGSRMIRISFYQTSQQDPLPLEAWVRICDAYFCA